MKQILYLLVFFLLFKQDSNASADKEFVCDSSYISIWNGSQYVPFQIKGINFGVAVPGTSPGELLVSRDQYGRWLSQIQAAGFNMIRLYTLHFPDFYEVLDSFNLANPNSPLFFMQNIWLEEDLPGYANDLYTLNSSFTLEIEEDIDCIHGNRTIPLRTGKAFGTYSADVSKWLCAYILGREVLPEEVIKSNTVHPGSTTFTGNYFSINSVTPSESWVCAHLDHAAAYEALHYNTVKPLSFSTWPTLDPLHHPAETNRMEDSVSIDLKTLQPSALSAGYFVSYHAYPYYPDFISSQQDYQVCSDYLGQNSYICYLEDLKAHYTNFPLLIAETGCPSSWGIAHYAQNGINHGGFDETEQGQAFIRLAENVSNTGCAGSVLFNWMDEWFKRTWITDPMDADPARRPLWHNITAAEQNFGLMGFKKSTPPVQWQQFSGSSQITSIDAAADYRFLTLKLHMPPPGVLDTILIGIDTYSSALGESVLPNGASAGSRSEFCLSITNYQADLLVTEAYDMYGVWFGNPAPTQVYKSTVSNNKPWNLVRWQNNDQTQSTQYIGHMKVNRLSLPSTSLDAVHIDTNFVEVYLPWTLLNFSDPSQKKVIHDKSSMVGLQDTTSDGISISIYYKGVMYHPSTRFNWTTWNTVTNATEYLKASYNVVRSNMYQLPGGLVANADSFTVNTSPSFTVNAGNGLLKNDYVLPGFNAQTFPDNAPQHGLLYLFTDGSFTFYPDAGYAGPDTFSYRILCGPHFSEATQVYLNIDSSGIWAGIYPNPSMGPLTISSLKNIDLVEVFDNMGKCIYRVIPSGKEVHMPAEFPTGIYFARIRSKDEVINKRFIIRRP